MHNMNNILYVHIKTYNIIFMLCIHVFLLRNVLVRWIKNVHIPAMYFVYISL